MIYLDNSATTVISNAALRKMQEAAVEIWGNPSSVHAFGIAAGNIMEEARKNILSSLGINDKNSGRLVFCGSGTEANNLAVFGTAYAKANVRRKRIITDDSQHPSVLFPLDKLGQENFEIVRIRTSAGRIDTEMLEKAINADTILVTVMLVNNETGARYDVENAFTLVKKINPAVVCHTDAVQAFKKIKFSPDSLHADLISVSGHKIHAPKGIGALYIADHMIRSKKIIPVIYGGGQEGGFRSGTENIPGIAAFGEAVKAEFDTEAVFGIREYLLSRLPHDIHANIPEVFAPHIISLTLPHIKSETMTRFLSESGIYISNGSACSSHSHRVSPVLLSFGLTKAQADCTIRVSLCGRESFADMDFFIAELTRGLKSLIRTK